MNSFSCRWWLSAVILFFAASAQAETIPITLSMTAISDLGPNTNIPFTAVPPDTLTLSTHRAPFFPDSPTFTELTLSGLEPDSIDRMLHYMPGDPPSYGWTITADNAGAFGVNWLEFQNHLNESKPREVLTGISFFNAAPPSGFNPIVNDFDSTADFLHRTGVPRSGGLWAKDFQLHEVKISVDYYFWHPILKGLRAVQIRAEIRAEARVVPEPEALPLLSLGLILVGLVAPIRNEPSSPIAQNLPNST